MYLISLMTIPGANVKLTFVGKKGNECSFASASFHILDNVSTGAY